MGLLILLQVVLDLAFIATATLILIERSKARTMEDPRLSRGLQLLSSKIAILQDLMDRSETMGKSLTQIIDSKQQDVQERMEDIEHYLHSLNHATEKSREVATIFQDKIPHEEILERQTTMKYMQAAKMAHQGMSVDEIARQLDIPRGELELIVKVNRDRLLVEKEPSWAKSMTLGTSSFKVDPVLASSTPVAAPTRAATSAPVNSDVSAPANSNVAASASISLAELTAAAAARAVPQATKAGTDKAESNVRPVVFKRINAANGLG